MQGALLQGGVDFTAKMLSVGATRRLTNKHKMATQPSYSQFHNVSHQARQLVSEG